MACRLSPDMLRTSLLGMVMAQGHWDEQGKALRKRRMIEAKDRELRLHPSPSRQHKAEAWG